MYHSIKFMIKPKDPLYSYCNTTTIAANNLRNAALFRVRQVLTLVEKPVSALTDNERFVLNEIECNLPIMGTKHVLPSRGKAFLSHPFLDSLMKHSCNPDYFAKDLSRQTAQHVPRDVANSMKAFYAACKAYGKNPDAFTGKPKLPDYGKRGSNHSVVLTNQDCTVYSCKDESHEVKLPITKLRFNLGKVPIPGTLQQANIVPTHDVFYLILVFDDGRGTKRKSQK